MAGMLSTDQVAAYRRDGFVGPVDLLTTAEAAALRRRIEAVEARMGDQIQKRCKIKAHLPFPFLCEVVAHPRLLDAVEDIIGPDILCWGSSFFQKEAHDPGFVSWHQDSAYYGIEPPDTLTAWLAISDSTLESGCMKFVPGSHNKGIYSHAELKSADNLLSRGQTILGVEEDRAVPMVLRAGQFSFHKEDCVHGSAPNCSNDRRIGLSIHFVAPTVRETAFPGASALLLRGRDREGHWGADRLPQRDWDPDCLAELDRTWTLYQTAPESRGDVA
jgi:ectoine hydroxylase-related dioxygenase (phytanoyl-CoA dioxygenase family)